MATLLYLAHRLPYPPDKGDKVRTHHVLRHLHEKHRVILGAFVDDSDDLRHADQVLRWCELARLVRLVPAWARLRALAGLAGGLSLTQGYFHDRAMARWVEDLRATGGIDAVVVSSSSMAQYAADFEVPILMDFIDVDSAKWGAYADMSWAPLAWLYRTEARRVLQLERRAGARAERSFFVSQRELELFRRCAPVEADRAEVMRNGVDASHYAPRPGIANPYEPGEVPVVFTGTMDYLPNVDAVTWFAREALPLLRRRVPAVRLSIVGRHPVAAVRALAGEAVRVTGAVDDVRPWLQHAAAVVVPMRLARGVQNKLLEAMAMGRPVVAARDCAEVIDAEPGRHLDVAADAAGFASAVLSQLLDPDRARRLGEAARRHVVERLDWATGLAPLDRALERCLEAA